MDDPRLTPARPDLAAKYLEGKVKAARFVTGEEFEVVDAIAPLREAPAADAELLTQALKGERVTIYDRNGEGFAWGQLNSDGYVGWIPDAALGKPGGSTDAQGHGVADLCVSGRLDQTAAGRHAVDGRADHGRARGRRVRRDARRLVPAAPACRPLDHDREGFRRGRRTLCRHALSVGRQEQPRHRLLRPGADRR